MSSSDFYPYLHSVEGGAGVEPADLLLVERVVQGNTLRAAVRVLQHGRQRLKKNMRFTQIYIVLIEILHEYLLLVMMIN